MVTAAINTILFTFNFDITIVEMMAFFKSWDEGERSKAVRAAACRN